jgi:HEAT repeat protein
MSGEQSLRERLNHSDESVRAFAAEDAGFDGRVEDVEPLVERLRRESSRHVRETIVNALSRMTHDIVVEHALALLDSRQDAFLRSSAVSLLQTRGEAVIGRLKAAYSDADGDVRKLLLDTASGISGAEAEALLLLGFRDSELNVRIAAVEYLGDRIRPDLKGHYEAIVQTETAPMMLSTALGALEQIGDARTWKVIEALDFGETGCPRYLAPQLLRVMAKCAPVTCLDKFFAEGKRLGAASVTDWIDGLETLQQRFGFRSIDPTQFEVLRAMMLTSPGPLAVLRLLRWLGRLDEQLEAFELLEASLESPEPRVRLGAALGLRCMATPQALSALGARAPLEADDEVRSVLLGVAAGAEEPAG